MRRSYTVLAAVVLLIAAAFGVLTILNKPSGAMRLGISPYQDTAIPVITEAEGIMGRRNINVELVNIAWESIVPSLASRGQTVDVAIGSINTLIPRAHSVNANSSDPVIFVAPLYVFKGASLIARNGSGIRPYGDLLAENGNDRARAAQAFVTQLTDQNIGFPSGSPYEQMFLQLVRDAGADRSAIPTREVQLADGLPALLSGRLDLAGAGVTQRTEAQRAGHYVAVELEDLGLAEIVGLVTTRSYYESHRAEIEALRLAWFDTIALIETNPAQATRSILDYLQRTASTRYTYEEYLSSLAAQEFFDTPEEAAATFDSSDGRFYWQRTWDAVNQYLLDTDKIEQAVSYEYYVRD